MTTTDHEGHTVTTYPNTAAVNVESRPTPDFELRKGMCITLPAEVLAEINQGVVLGLRSGNCFVVPADAWCTGAQVDLTGTANETDPKLGDAVIDRAGVVWQYDGRYWARPGDTGRVTGSDLMKTSGPLAPIARTCHAR